MKLLFIGPENIYKELVETLPANVTVIYNHQPTSTGSVQALADNENYDVVFDALFDKRIEFSEQFVYPTTNLIIGSSVKRKLSDSRILLNKHINSPVIGMNMLPTFIKSKTKEITSNDNEALKRFNDLTLAWQWNYKNVRDELGLVAPRVLAMVVNEAAHTLEENTATKEDIDQGMELGTGYPEGPLKWCDRIGVEHITDVLQSLYESTGDARYKTSSLLLRMRKARETFY